MEASINSRIKKIMDHYAVSPAAFADKINVQRSGISHILSDRNKPSLEFIQKTIAEFPQINPIWLLNGSGEMILTGLPNITTESFKVNFETTEKKDENLFTDVITSVNKEENKGTPKKEENLTERTKNSNSKKIEKIILLYSDGSFDFYLK